MDISQHDVFEFEFEELHYVITVEAKERGLIALPDGRTLHVASWINTPLNTPFRFAVISDGEVKGSFLAKIK